jgi:hypothetical protein
MSVSILPLEGGAGMKKLIITLFAAGAVIVLADICVADDFGVGAVVGDPTGFSGKIWSNDRNAVDFALAWSLDDERSFDFHADYLIHDYTVFNVTHGKLPLYYGIGGRLMDARDTHVGLRGVIGLDYLFSRSPLDLFFEIAPVLDMTPETAMDLEAGIGMRFYFR